MKKILLISVGEHFGGIEKLEVEYVKRLRKTFKIDIMALNDSTFKRYEKILNKKNSKLHNLNIKKFTRRSEIIYDLKLFKFLKKNKYDIIHINSGVFFYSFRVALISRICGVKKIIVHSHSYENRNKIKIFFKNILNPIYRKMVDEYLTCSENAKISLFSKGFIERDKKNNKEKEKNIKNKKVKNKNDKKIKVIKNGIDIDKIKYNEETRKEYIDKLELKNKVVYAHIGRISKIKNHNFLIDIYRNIVELQDNSILLIIGDGEEKDKELLKEKCKSLNIEDKVKFLGFRDDVYNILNAVDFLIFPSKAEGLGMVVIEAQANGIKAFCSESVPKEANISNELRFFKFKDDTFEIAKRVRNAKKNTVKYRNEAYKYAVNNGYDINDVCSELKRIYKNLLKDK